MAQRCKAFAARHRAALGAVLVLLCAALACFWTWYDLHARVDDRPQYAIQNDEYTRRVRIGPTGLDQTLQCAAGQTLHGVRLNMTTYGHAFRSCTVTAELRSEQGDLLATCTVPCTGMLDNTFADFVFDRPYTAARAETLHLRLTFQAVPEQEGGDWVEGAYPVGLWASRGELDGWPLTDGLGRRYNGTLAIQYITNHSAHTSGALALRVGLLVCAALTAAFVLLAFRGRAGPGGAESARRRLPLAAAAMAGALGLGAAFALVTPPLVAPDEYTHLAVSYRMAGRLTGAAQTTDAEGRLLVRACDAPWFSTRTGQIGIFAYTDYLGGLNAGGGNDPALTEVSAATETSGSVNNALYTAQSLGLALARRTGQSFHTMLLWGRLANLLAYATLTGAALLLAPASCAPLLACAVLLPMPLQLAGSLSPDAGLLGLTALFTALVLRLRQQPARLPGRFALAALTAAVAPLKAIYLPLVLLVLLVPPEHLGATRRAGRAVQAASLALAALLWTAANLQTVFYAARDLDFVGLARGGAVLAVLLLAAGGAALLLRRHPAWRPRAKRAGIVLALLALPVVLYRLTHMYGGLTPEQLAAGIQPNGDSIYTYSFGYILRNLPGTAKLLVRSVCEQGGLWLQGLLGTTLGEPIVYRIDVSWLLGIGLLAALLAAALPPADDLNAPPLGRRARRAVGGVVLAVAALVFLAALGWTPINYTTIFGVQGRYLLPVLPLALLLVRSGRTVTAQHSLGRRAVFTVLCLTSLVLLQGFSLYAAWQPAQ